MKRSIILLVLALVVVGLLAIGCVPAATPEPQNPAEIAMTMAAQKMDAEATQMRIGIQYTATAQVIEVTQNVMNTQAAVAVTEQFRADVQATDQQNRRDMAATEQRIRDDAATQQARRDAEATAEQGRQNVIATSTAQQAAIWNGMTQQVAPIHDQWTQQAVYGQQTKEASDAKKAKLEADQQEDKNTAEWVVPLLVVLAVVAVFAVVQIRRSRVREVKNEEDGTVVGLLIDGSRFVNPDLMPSAIIDLRDDEVTSPELTDKETQNEVTRRAQGVKALKAMPANMPPQMSAGLYNGVFGNAQQERPRIEIVDAENVREWVSDVSRQADDQEAK